MTHLEPRNWSITRLLTVIILASVATGAVTGLGLGYVAQYEGPQQRVIYLFNNSLPFNASALGIPPDVFSPDHITVNRGDTVIIDYNNIENPSGGDPHTFTMGDYRYPGPYHFNIFVPPGKSVTIQFVANIPGVFVYYCTIHYPTMIGYLTVIG